ncbi:class I SAM-dependent methyltransferase [Rhizobium sp. LC145]|uniref:class I SAM-dependent methyltransferase n=1 Tax=Rhizobium sp. LC145 TaxID=1120688 RepID=UPI000629EAB5|nr:class I SAM-dependent methyltransferase [Rhizobium sp. LC145]KKX28294.1 SAM-dependent methyltransferase [Rhizobium sp. LC145]TKT58279.1 class I SAM-dependent methyltransferase [Rhizobiaceae bacterium LC148]
MAQNIYDKPEFFEGYSQLPRSVHGLAGAPEWPSIQAQLPALKGLRVLDLGCGFGWFCRFAAGEGAASVLGLDLSQNMIDRARAETSDPAVRYEIADLEHVELPGAAFDLVYSSLAFHYLEDFGRMVRKVERALVPGGSFVFTIEHPIYMAPTQPGFRTDEAGRRIWPVDGYSVEGKRTTDWLAKGVIKYHRTLGTTINTLIDAGFVLDRLVEWHPSPEQLAANPAFEEEMDRPMMMILSAHLPD